MTHKMPSEPLDMRGLSQEEVDDAARFLEDHADYILAFRQPLPDETQYAVIALLFKLHPPDYCCDALAHFHALPAEADLFFAVYEAHYTLHQRGIHAKPRPARHYILQATAMAPHNPLEPRT